MINIGIVSERLISRTKSKRLLSESCSYPCNILNYQDLIKYINECKIYNDYKNAIKALKSEKLSPIDIKHGATYIAENIIPNINSNDLDHIINNKFIMNFNESYYHLINECKIDINDFYNENTLNQIEPSLDYQIKREFCENRFISDESINLYINKISENPKLYDTSLMMSVMESGVCSLISYKAINQFLINKNIIHETYGNYDTINAFNESCKTIQEAAKKYRAADRVIKNHDALSGRYNFDKIVDENKNLFTKDQSDCIYEICKLMDTFNLSFNNRYNMYLENSLYLLHKNGVEYDINNIAESVTDYMMMAYPMDENNINTINKILNTNLFFKDCEYYKTIKESYDNKFKKSYMNYISESYFDKFNNEINDTTLKSAIESDLNKMYSDGLNYYHQWINEGKEESGSKARFISDKINKVKDLAKNASKEGLADGDKVIKDDNKVSELIDNFKKQDKKDIGKFKSLIVKIYSKDPEDAINNTPSILNIIRIGLALGVASFSPFIGIIMLIVDQVISLNINRKQTDKLLKYFYNEKEKVENKLYNSSKDKENLKAYLKKLEDAINKLENHKDDLKSDVDNENDDDKEVINDMAYIMTMCESANAINNFDVGIITNAIKEHYETIPGEFIDSVTELSLLVNDVIDRQEILKALEFAYDKMSETNINDIVTETNIRSCLSENISKIRYCENDYEDFDVPIIELADILTSLQNSITQENCLHEGMSFKNTFKLAAINIKDKITNLSDKEKSACKTINAMANNIKNKIETSITNSNREAVIRGSILPSFSTLIKMIIASAGAIALKVNIGVIVAGWIGALACRAIMTNKERTVVLDDIESEIEVVEKKMAIAEREEDFDKYKELLKLSKKLKREAQRIRYKINATGRSVPKID